MTKNNRQFREFLRDEVNLNQDRLHRLQISVRDVNCHMKSHLTGYQNIDRQGSYGLDTLVKPVNEDDEYDADIQVVMNPNSNWKARDYLDALWDTLARNHNFTDKIKLGIRCITLNYARDFHLDVVPRVTWQGGTLHLQPGVERLRGDGWYGLPQLVLRTESDNQSQPETSGEIAQVRKRSSRQLHSQVYLADHAGR